jgi:trans-2,3-dihydro-3-hydroxyanthranilate isomerase
MLLSTIGELLANWTVMANIRQHSYELIDVFTDKPLTGNQLAVFPHGDKLDDKLLQQVARELNLSETVFLFPPQSEGDMRMRIFTSWCELPFAGHPVLGTACVIARRQSPEGITRIRLETQKDIISVEVTLTPGQAPFGRMDQPIPTIGGWGGSPEELLRTLNVPEPVIPIEFYHNGVPHLYLMLPNIADVLAIQPSYSALREVCAGARINCFAGEGSTYTSRMFSPFELAMPEDPACGSAAGPLAAHLVLNGVITSGQEITIFQGEKVGRPSTLFASATGEGKELHRIRVGGSCYPIGQGNLCIP